MKNCISKLFPVIAVSVTMVSGCMSLSGFDAGSSFACKAPDGVLCESMSGIYANVEQNNLPGQQVKHGNEPRVAADPANEKKNQVLTKPISSGTPIRSAPQVMRIWFAPWEDSDGDLHDQNYLYMTVDTGHWLVEHQRRQIQERYKPVFAPTKQQASPSATREIMGGAHTGTDQMMTSIGTVQSRPTEQETAAMIEGIQTPAQSGQQ